MAKKKPAKKINKPVKPTKTIKPIAKYVGSTEIYIPKFNKIVNKGDLVPEFPLLEALARRDFIVINKEE